MLKNHKNKIFSMIILLGLLALAGRMRNPIPEGDAEDYWEFACGIELKEFDGYFPYAHWTGIFPDMDGWFFYYFQEHHGRHVFKVRKRSLLDQVDEVFALLDKEIVATVQEISRDTIKAKNERRIGCLEAKEIVNSDKERFIDEISARSKNNIKRVRDIESFRYQWEIAKLYWVSILFEAVFLAVWWLFSFHAGAFGRFNRNLSTRLAFSPLLLFVSTLLGVCALFVFLWSKWWNSLSIICYVNESAFRMVAV